MGLLTAGYWPSGYWPSAYWVDDYWPEYAYVVTMGPLHGVVVQMLALENSLFPEDTLYPGSDLYPFNGIFHATTITLEYNGEVQQQ